MPSLILGSRARNGTARAPLALCPVPDRAPRSVLVIGAGPAGTACAITLADAGHAVTLVDKAVFPRDKCCGDGLTTNALRILEELGLDPADVPDWSVTRDLELRSPDGRRIGLALPDGPGTFAAVAPRRQLDHALLELARARGVDIHEGRAFVDVVRNDSEAVTVSIEGLGEVTADHLVAADGMWSPVRRALGLSEPGRLGEWHAFRQYIGNVTGSAAHRLHIWFDDDLLPGYAWSFPLPGNRANLGFGVLRTEGRSTKFMNDLWRDLLGRPHVVDALGPGFQPEDRHTAWPIPARIDRAVRSSGRVLFVGDAVAATDLLTGEGIGQALETGIAAARAIDGSRDPAAVRRAYSDAIDSVLLADHRMSVVLSWMLSRPNVARRVLRLVDTNDWTRRNFARWMFEDEPRAVLLTPRRWHRGFLSRPGAYRS